MAGWLTRRRKFIGVFPRQWYVLQHVEKGEYIGGFRPSGSFMLIDYHYPVSTSLPYVQMPEFPFLFGGVVCAASTRGPMVSAYVYTYLGTERVASLHACVVHFGSRVMFFEVRRSFHCSKSIMPSTTGT